MHAGREKGQRALTRQNNAGGGLQQGQAGCRPLKRPVKLLHRFTTTSLNNLTVFQMQDRFRTHGMHNAAKEGLRHLDQLFEFPELEGSSCKGSAMGDIGTVPSRARLSYRTWFVPSKCEHMDQQMISSCSSLAAFEQLFSFSPKKTAFPSAELNGEEQQIGEPGLIVQVLWL